MFKLKYYTSKLKYNLCFYYVLFLLFDIFQCLSLLAKGNIFQSFDHINYFLNVIIN